MNKRKIALYKISDLLIRSLIERIASGRFEILNFSSAGEIKSALDSSRESIVICDLPNVLGELGELISSSKQVGAKVLGFYPHVETGIRRSALSHGIDYVVPRSAFGATLRRVLETKLATAG